MKQRSRGKDMSVIRVCWSNLQAGGAVGMALHLHVSTQGAVLLVRKTMLERHLCGTLAGTS